MDRPFKRQEVDALIGTDPRVIELVVERERLRREVTALYAVVAAVVAPPPTGVRCTPVLVPTALYQQAQVLVAQWQAEEAAGSTGSTARDV